MLVIKFQPTIPMARRPVNEPLYNVYTNYQLIWIASADNYGLNVHKDSIFIGILNENNNKFEFEMKYSVLTAALYRQNYLLLIIKS